MPRVRHEDGQNRQQQIIIFSRDRLIFPSQSPSTIPCTRGSPRVHYLNMPELPEVETIRGQIAPQICRQRIVSAHVGRSRAVRAHRSPAEFIALVTGRVILDVCRRGKALLLPLEHDRSLLVRLGMSGFLTVKTPETPQAPHTHVILELSNGMELRYIDPRTFGQVAVVDGHDPDRMVELAHYGYEPLDDTFTPTALREVLRGKTTLIQTVLDGSIAGRRHWENLCG